MLTRRGFLGTSLALGGGLLVRASRGASPVTGPARRLIVIMAQGGWDTCYAIDPKEPPGVAVPDGAVQYFGNLDIFCHASRPNVTAYFQRHAAKTAIVRGIATSSIIHVDCHRRILTGTRLETNPDMAAIVAHDCGNDLPLPYLILGPVAYTGAYAASAGRAGFQNQLGHLIGPGSNPDARGNHDPPISLDPLAGTPHASEAEDAAIRRFHQASVERARAQRGALGYNRKRLDDFLEANTRATRLKGLHSAFGTGGAGLDFAAQLPIAISALEQDVAQAVMLNTGGVWDTHYDNPAQGPCHDALFASLTALVDELEARPGRTAGSRMIDDTIVAVVSEFSRTPLLYDNGKGHWPVAAAMVIGGGVRGNIVIGGTTPTADARRIDLRTGAVLDNDQGVWLTPALFVAAVLEQCGVDPSAHIDTSSALEALRA